MSDTCATLTKGEFSLLEFSLYSQSWQVINQLRLVYRALLKKLGPRFF
jgi:hypothetical protein